MYLRTSALLLWPARCQLGFLVGTGAIRAALAEPPPPDTIYRVNTPFLTMVCPSGVAASRHSCGVFSGTSCQKLGLRDYPSSPHEHVIAAWLATGKEVAVVSHQSALGPWDLSDVVPTAIHLTVPRARPSLANRPPPGVVVHTTEGSWGDGEVRSHEAVHLTSPERTILDAAETGTQPEQIELAIAQGLSRGWIDARRLRTTARARGRRVANLIERALAMQEPGDAL
jgi:hypothetical protein